MKTERDEAVQQVRDALDTELARRTFEYTRSDGSVWKLSLADLVARMKAMEMAYLTPYIAKARAEVIKILDVQAGETALDIGSGPGFLAKDLASGVGPKGSAHGVDLAENMVEAGRKLCADQPWAEFHCADAMLLPYPDASFVQQICRLNG